MAHTIEIVRQAVNELRAIPMHIRRAIAAAIDEQLIHQPTLITRNRKPLPGLTPSFEHVPPVWELKVGDYRVFYDMDEEEGMVFVRAIRHKDKGKATEDIT